MSYFINFEFAPQTLRLCNHDDILGDVDKITACEECDARVGTIASL